MIRFLSFYGLFSFSRIESRVHNEKYHLLADGLPSSAEYMIGNGSLAAHETCVGTDYPWTLNEGVFTSRVFVLTQKTNIFSLW